MREPHHRAAKLLIATLMVVWSSAAIAAREVRKSISELTPQELTSLRHGVQQMMNWDQSPPGSANFKRSWAYWANMHAHFGADCAGPVTGAGMTRVTEITATTPDEQVTWCACQHGTYGFLTWHRMYLYYFERVLQAAANDPSLTLPYWDYEHEPKLPLAFRDQTYVDGGVKKPNPLYVAERRAQLNAGTAGLDAATVSTDEAFQLLDYWSNGAGFSPILEQTPHGAVHCAVGVLGCQTGLMGAVPSAALDPIFYLHHANIDRLYECWLRADPSHRTPSDPARVKDSYSFPDGSGAVVQRLVGDMLTSAKLEYAYSRPGSCPASLKPPGAGFQTIPQRAEYMIGGSAAIGPRGGRNPLSITAGARTAVLRSPFQTGTPSRQAVVIQGLSYARAPASLYKVYLVRGQKRALLGTLNFFSAQHAMPGMAMGPAQTSTPVDVLFLASGALRTLGLDTDANAEAHLEFVAATGISGETVDDAERLNTPQDNLHYAGIKLLTDKP